MQGAKTKFWLDMFYTEKFKYQTVSNWLKHIVENIFLSISPFLS